MNAILLDTYSLHSLLAPQPCQTKAATGLGFPEVRIDSYNRPGTHGKTISHSLYGGRVITLNGTIRGADRATFMANRAALEAAVSLQLDSNNVPIARTLYLTDLTFDQYSIPVITKSFVCDITSPTMGQWQLQLEATTYVIESQTISTATTYLPKSGGIIYPVAYPVRYGASSGGSVIASNLGNAAAYPTVTLYGPMINPVVANDNTGESVRLNLTLSAGDVLTIDMRRRLIVQGTNTNKMGSLLQGSRFWAVQPGNNSLRVGADVFDVGYAVIAWRASKLGL